MHHFKGWFAEVSFATSKGNQLSHFQNQYFFKILWKFHEPHNQVKCRLKNKICYLNFSLRKNNEICRLSLSFRNGVYIL